MKIDKIELLAGVNNPKIYYCSIWLYTTHHSEIAVRVMSTLDESPATNKFYWIFTGVVYFEGPLKWQGADIYFDDIERGSLVKKIYPTFHNIEELISSDTYRLFKFADKISELEVRILASGVMRVEKLP